MNRSPQAILTDLDLLRDRRQAKDVAEDEYHAESDRLWTELRETDREARRAARKQIEEERRSARQLAKEEHERRPKVYCDGACEPGQPLGVGVFSSDCGIAISLQLDQRGTNNVAECLGAITALEECKKRGFTGIRLLSDSQLVVCWTRGDYALRSATARRYVPQIQRLLAEVNGVIEWIPGERNLADKYSRGLQNYPADLSPLDKLKTMPPGRLTFKDFRRVKSGRDEFSRLRKAMIVQMIGTEEWSSITASFDKEKYHLSAARWRLGGIPLETAIRKVQVDREVGHEVAAKRGVQKWNDGE